MLTPDVQQLAAQLQSALGLSVVCGSVTLNFNNGDLQSVKTETHQRIAPRPQKPLDPTLWRQKKVDTNWMDGA